MFSMMSGTLSFAHKSFQEYLVAAWLVETMAESPDETAVALRNYMSPEVDEFVKESIHQAKAMPRYLSRIASNCMAAYELNRGIRLGTTDGARARMACEQLGYFLGNISSADVKTFLVLRLQQETDPWLRRGIICGLAVGGDESFLHAYVERLTEERAGPLPHRENDVNLGFQLSFCGDQPFDPLAPEKDQGLPSCEQTIRQLVYQLGTEVDRGSWRINLYTIIDFCRNRPASAESAGQVIRENVSHLRHVHRRLSSDDNSRSWPELRQLEQMIEQIDAAAVPPSGG